uniref:MULE transposase domain-containing protein n=1 Tax=Lactuca sativa TaxID=4236 RepID=A0A9R1UWW3_LACSA|nr:hypothetical protein LSAT_V11C700366360 [Lactuca sativa]
MMSNSKEIDESIATDTIGAEINSSRNDKQIDSISLTSEELQNTIHIELKKFFELHNHPLESIKERPYTKKAKKMSYSEKEFVVRASKVKFGPTMAHKIQAVLKEGYEYVGAKVTNYKNLRREVNRILCYKDAQIMINKMNDRRDHYPNYSFEFLRDGDMLAAMFWADERENAFYADLEKLYLLMQLLEQTSKLMYKMVFVPFTTVDHHKKLVTVGTGLLSRETIESYERLIKAFLRAHEWKAQKIVLTDQDPTIKQVVESVLPNSRHRLCMLHIMKKQAKVTDDLFKNKDFKKRFNKLVWSMHIKPAEFEKKWELIINELNLEDKIWFNDMFELRDKWIPAYFSDTRMSGLMKTTSRSKSMNSFFSTYLKSGNLLLHFMMNYDTTNQKQRNTQKELDHQTKKAVYTFISLQLIKKHAVKVYTSTLFYEVHKEIYKGSCEINRPVNQAYYNFEACLEYIRQNKDKMDLFGKKTESMLKEYENDPTNELQKNRIDVEEVGKLMGISIPKDIDINVPNVQSNKGSGKKNIIQSAANIAYKNSNKQTRRCSGCRERAPRNLRTCPIKLAAE